MKPFDEQMREDRENLREEIERTTAECGHMNRAALVDIGHLVQAVQY
jgi:hypothetical protein